MAGRSAVAEVMDGAGDVSAVAAELQALEAAMADPGRAAELEGLVERFGEVQARFEELGGYALEGRAREVLAGLSFSQEMMEGDVGALSGGWKMRVALARILLMRPDVMLLDEPSNHLDIATKRMLIAALAQHEGTMLFVPHDRHFLAALSNRVLELTPEGTHQYGGGHTEYLARTGQEAPGLHHWDSHAAPPGRCRNALQCPGTVATARATCQELCTTARVCGKREGQADLDLSDMTHQDRLSIHGGGDRLASPAPLSVKLFECAPSSNRATERSCQNRPSSAPIH